MEWLRNQLYRFFVTIGPVMYFIIQHLLVIWIVMRLTAVQFDGGVSYVDFLRSGEDARAAYVLHGLILYLFVRCRLATLGGRMWRTAFDCLTPTAAANLVGAFETQVGEMRSDKELPKWRSRAIDRGLRAFLFAMSIRGVSLRNSISHLPPDQQLKTLDQIGRFLLLVWYKSRLVTLRLQ